MAARARVRQAIQAGISRQVSPKSLTPDDRGESAMIILGNDKYIEARFRDEQEIEDVVLANSEHFFGPSSLLIPKRRIATKDGMGTIADAFAVDLASCVWNVVEAESSQHNVWTHIAPQVTKQLLAANQPETRQLLTEIIVQMYDADAEVKDKFSDEGIREIDIRKVLGEVFGQSPIIGMPIDRVPDDLREWGETLRNDVRLWTVKKYVQLGTPGNVAYEIPEEYRPTVDTSGRDGAMQSRRAYDVSLTDLLRARLVAEGDELTMAYAPRGAKRKTFRATVNEDGTLEVLGEVYSSLSYAALACIQSVGSERTTVNGWSQWRLHGKTLADIRQDYLRLLDTDQNDPTGSSDD